MNAHDSAVDHRVFIVGVGRQIFKSPVPDTLRGPMTEAPMGVYPVPAPLRQIAARRTSAIPIELTLNKQAVVCCGGLAALAAVQNLYLLIVAQGKSSLGRHRCQLQNR